MGSRFAAGENPAPVIAGYDLLRRIGRGSYGEVWLAREMASGSFRAVKVVYRHTFEHDRPFERELSGIQKFEPVSRTHPSQVHILRVGRDHKLGCFYYVMELADDSSGESGKAGNWEGEQDAATDSATGPRFHSPLVTPATYNPRTLKHELQRRGRLPFRECLNISLALTTALEHLHANDLIHRDIKPSNVIFVNGVPKLADIGLVTDIGATISHVGTEGFLPPEGPGTPQADLYSLGKVLYEISTGRDRLDFPELPTFVENSTEKETLLELNLIFLKACQNDVRKRYQSAREMFADLALLQSGKSLRRARILEQRLGRLRLTAVAGAAGAVLIVGANFFIQQQRVKRAEAERIRQQYLKEYEQRISTKRREQVLNLYTANGENLQNAGDVAGALVWFSKAFLEEGTASTNLIRRRERLAEMFKRCHKTPVLIAHRGAVNAANWSADGKRLVTASDDHTAQVWDAQSGEPLGPALKHDAPVRGADLSPDGTRVLTFSAEGRVVIWDLSSGSATPLQPIREVKGAFLSPAGRQVLTIGDDRAALLWETGSARTRFVFQHEQPVLRASFSSDGRLAATASADRTARVWNTESGEPVTGPLVHEARVTLASFSSDGRRLLTCAGRRVRVWNARSGEPAFFVLPHDAEVKLAIFSPDNQFIATASEDSNIRLWNSVTGESIRQFPASDASVHDLRFSPDGQWLAVASGERVQRWSVRQDEPAFLIVHNGVVRGARFSPSGQFVLTSSDDRTARITGTALASWSFLSSSNAAPGQTPERWAEFLSGRHVSISQKLLPLSSDVLRELWRVLKQAHPSDFAPEDAVAWHRGQAEACEGKGDWFGARFHW